MSTQQRGFFAVLAILLWVGSAAAQWPAFSPDVLDTIQERKAEMFRYRQIQLAEAKQTPNQERYDVIYYGIDLAIDPIQEMVTGTVQVRAAVVDDPIDHMEVDLLDNMTVTQVTVSGATASFTHQNDLVDIDLDSSYTSGEIIDVAIEYSGSPVAAGLGSFVFDSHAGKPMIWSLSDPYGARNWWPCKDQPVDKADSVDIRVTVPKGMIVASNGILRQVMDNGDTETYWWHEGYPIVTYLVSLAIYDYEVYSDYFVYTPTDSMEIQFYVFPDHMEYVQTNYAKTKDMLRIFSDLFGLYPFIEEKYGHAEFTWGGGMEHQTCTSLGGWSEALIAHELAHQWWGDMITCRDFHHIWLNEGFATYSEALYWEQVAGKEAYFNDMNNNQYFGGGTIYVPDLSDIGRIFHSGLSYNKGSWVLHMLRHVVGDSTFFDILQAYYDSEFQHGTAVTEDFQAVCESVSGMGLSWFFQEWIYQPGYPQYEYSWQVQEIGGENYLFDIQISQTNQYGPLFRMPVDLNLSYTGGDTTFTLWVEADAFQEINVPLTLPTGSSDFDLIFDLDNWVLDVHEPLYIAIQWRNESERPLPFAVSNGLTLQVKPTVCTTLNDSPNDAEITGNIEPPNFYYGETVVAAGFPAGTCSLKTLSPYFTAQSVDTIPSTVALELTMSGDSYKGSNALDYRFQVTPRYTCLLGYDDHEATDGKATSDSTGPAVMYSVHDGCYPETKDSCYLFEVSFNSYDGPEPATQSGHEFTLHIYDNVDTMTTHNPPTTTVMGTELASLTDTTSGDNTWHAVSFNHMVRIPEDTFWIWFEHSDKRPSFPGMASDGIMIDGERSWTYDMTGDSLYRGEAPNLRGSPEDWMMRTYIIPKSQIRTISGRVDTATSKGAPVTAALVTAEMHTTGAGSAPVRWDITDGSGNYSIECWPGVYDLTASYLDFTDGHISDVDVTTANAVNQNFELSRGTPFRRGDANDNGSVEMMDASSVLYYYALGSPVPSCMDAGDANDNGSVEMMDASSILYYYALGSPETPAPGPITCGLDPTDDGIDCQVYTSCSKAPPKVDISVGRPEDSKLAVGEGVVSRDGSVNIPLELTNAEPLIGFTVTIRYDPQLLVAQPVVNDGLESEGFDFFISGIHAEKGEVRIAAITDMGVEERLQPGSHRVANLVFGLANGALQKDVPLEITEATLAVDGIHKLNRELVSGLVKPSSSSLPTEFALQQNYPNPFNPTTLIRYDLPVDCQVRLEVYNVVGQRVATLVDGEQKAGYKVVNWNAKDLASGVYFYRLSAGHFASIKKMVVLK